MRKCDFCTESDQKGRCFWDTCLGRKEYCEKAIKIMTSVLKENKNLTVVYKTDSNQEKR